MVVADPIKIEIDSDCESGGHVVHLWLPRKGWKAKISGPEHKKWVAKNKEELSSVFQQIVETVFGK